MKPDPFSYIDHKTMTMTEPTQKIGFNNTPSKVEKSSPLSLVLYGEFVLTDKSARRKFQILGNSKF